MARLPQPGGDNGNWGDILNDYLSQTHKADGSFKDNVVTSSAIGPDAVSAAQIQDGTISEAQLDNAVQTKLNSASGSADWNSISNKPAVIAAGSTQANAKAALGLVKADVGLDNVNNTSDANKPVSTATQTALNGKLNMPTGTPNGTKFLRDDNSWQVIASSSSATIRKQSIMALGDSLSAAVSSYDSVTGVDSHLGPGGGHSPYDWLFLGNVLAGSPLDVLGSVASAGYTVEQIRDTHLPTVLAAAPEYCVCFSLGGNNILASGEFSSSMLAVSKYVIDQLAAAGITPVLATLPPLSSGNVTQNEIARYNSWTVNYAQKHGYPVLDFYSVLVDQSTGVYKAEYTTDNIHPNTLGTAAMGPVVRDLINKLTITGTRAVLASHNGVITGQLANPLLVRTGGAANTPDGWATSSLTLSLASSGAWPGNEWTLTSPGSSGYAIGPTLAGSVGNEWDLSFRIQTAPVTGGGWGALLYDQSSSVVFSIGNTDTSNPTVFPAGSIIHLRGKFGSGVTLLQPLLYTLGSGFTVKIGQLTFRNLSSMTIPL